MESKYLTCQLDMDFCRCVCPILSSILKHFIQHCQSKHAKARTD